MGSFEIVLEPTGTWAVFDETTGVPAMRGGQPLVGLAPAQLAEMGEGIGRRLTADVLANIAAGHVRKAMLDATGAFLLLLPFPDCRRPLGPP